MKSCLLTIFILIIVLLLEAFALWIEWVFLRPIFIEYDITEWLTLIIIGVFLGIPMLGRHILERIYPDGNNKRKQTVLQKENSEKPQNQALRSKPSYIINKPLGGYKREQLNEIFLIGVLIHQLYFSNIGNNLTESQQKKSLDVQMRFFITVNPHKKEIEYFDFAEKFISQNSNIFNLSISESIERSIQILSSCDSTQIAKLRKLFQALASCYSEIGGGNKIAMTAYASMVDTELNKIVVEEDWISHYLHKKSQ